MRRRDRLCCHRRVRQSRDITCHCVVTADERLCSCVTLNDIGHELLDFISYNNDIRHESGRSIRRPSRPQAAQRILRYCTRVFERSDIDCGRGHEPGLFRAVRWPMLTAGIVQPRSPSKLLLLVARAECYLLMGGKITRSGTPGTGSSPSVGRFKAYDSAQCALVQSVVTRVPRS